jgi:hypothetical protein
MEIQYQVFMLSEKKPVLEVGGFTEKVLLRENSLEAAFLQEEWLHRPFAVTDMTAQQLHAVLRVQTGKERNVLIMYFYAYNIYNFIYKKKISMLYINSK